MTQDFNQSESAESLEISTARPEASDDAVRRKAVAQLACQLEMGGDLVAQCETQAAQIDGDRAKPLFAGARLLSANAQIARALALLAQVETRHRSIVETIQPPNPRKAELNSRFRDERSVEKMRLELALRVENLVAHSLRAPPSDTPNKDRATLLQESEERIARLTRELAEG